MRVGILGAGQLARMLCLSAFDMGLTPYVLASKSDDCAVEVAADYVLDDGSDERLIDFLARVECVTIENEFLDLDRVGRVLGEKSFFPTLFCLRKIQNKLDQKKALKLAKISTLDFMSVSSLEELHEASKKIRKGIVLKKAIMGYDGYGTFIFKKDFNPEKFWQTCDGKFDGYAEELVKFKKELAVVVARSQNGEMKCFPVVETFQKEGKCDWVMAKAQLPSQAIKKAEQIAKKIMTTFDGVGVFGIEMFWLGGQNIVVNEIAPRVHNSGHFTQNGVSVSQFEQHWRAVLGYELCEPTLIAKGYAMVNLIGKNESSGHDLRKGFGKDTWIHWYGKQSRPGRKLGHINAIGMSGESALKKALLARKKIGF